jgi:serine/threonine-protein kinase HipA
MTSQKLVHVYFMRGNDKLPMGRLAIKDQKVFFEYTQDFIKTELELSPFKLPLKAGVISSEDRIFQGLFGVFNDSLPDGWGRLLLDRKIMTLNLNPNSLTTLDRLCYVGKHGMGALIYEPEIDTSSKTNNEDLDEIAEEILQFQENDSDYFVDSLLSLNGSSAGARPKITMKIAGEEWIIKFASSFDPKDIGPIEYAYNLMGRAAKLNIPDIKLFQSKKGPGYFGVKRFDRIDNKRIHMHSMSGLLHADHRELNMDYSTILKTTIWLTRDMLMGEKQFRAAVFNVLSHNRDDHTKNFSFLMNEKGLWSVSPSYDLTFSSGPNGEHCSTVMGEGKSPKLQHLLKLAETIGIKKNLALEIIDEVKYSISKWRIFAEEANVSPKSQKLVQTAIDSVIKNL